MTPAVSYPAVFIKAFTNQLCLGYDVNTVILSTVENCAGVLSANLPTLLPIWQFVRYGRVVSSRALPSAYYPQNKTPRSHRNNAAEYELNSQGSIRQLKYTSIEEYGTQRSVVDQSEL